MQTILPPPRPPAPTRRHFWTTLTTEATPAQVWRVWTDLSLWPDFDPEMERAETPEGDGRFVRLGQSGTGTSGGRELRFEVTHFAPGRAYTFTTEMPLGKLHVHRTLDALPAGGTRLTHEVWFSGASAPVFALLLGGRFREALAGVVPRVAQLALAQPIVPYE